MSKQPEQPEVNPNLGAQFASLTYQGQLYYADRVKDGAGHDQAYKDARYSYGTKR